MMVYGVFPYVVETLIKELKTGLSAALHLLVTDAKVVSSLQFVTGLHVRTVVMGLVELSSSWEDKMLQGAERLLVCFTENLQLRSLVVEEVGKFSDFLADSVFDGVTVVQHRMDIQVIEKELRMFSIRLFRNVEPHSMWTGW